MHDQPAGLLDRGVPDATDTAVLPTVLAAEVDHLAGRTQRWLDAGSDVHPAITARALVDELRYDEAAAEIARWTTASIGSWPLHGLTAGLWAAARAGDESAVRTLAAALAGCGDRFLIDDGVPLGPAALFGGIAAAALGDADGALSQLRAAVACGDDRAPVWGALARLELARVVLGTPGFDEDSAHAPLFSAQMFFTAGGYRHLAAAAARLADPPSSVTGAEPGIAHLVPGESWTIGFGVQVPVRVRGSKGLRALHELIARPDSSIPAVALDEMLSVPPGSAPGGGAGRFDLAEIDLDALEPGVLDQLRGYYLDDRVRSRMSKLLHRTITRIGEVHAFLGRHLAESVQTGHACLYRPEHPVRWRC